jgi:hypothetical protein
MLEVDSDMLRVRDEGVACTEAGVEVAAYSEAGIEDSRQWWHSGVQGD